MASIYEKPPLFKSQKTWNEKTILPKVYKLMSSNPCNKNKAKIHKDSGLLELNSPSIRQYPTLIKGQTKSNSTTLMRLSSLRTYLRVRWTRPGSMFSKNTSQNRLMTQQAFYCRSQTETLRKVLWEPSNSSFSVVRMRRSFETGSWSTIILVAISRFERTLE